MNEFSHLNEEIQKAKEWLKGEYATLRTGQATPAILDKVSVESYGTMMPINQVASITTEGAKSIKISPWDNSLSKNIEKAVVDADLGVSVNVDDSGVRVIFPELTGERRESLVKIIKQKHEDSRVTIRNAREKTWEDLQKKEKASEITEDDKFKLKDEMQKVVDSANAELTEIFEKKQKEVLEN